MSGIAVIDYGAGNLRSVRNALAYIGAAHYLASSPKDLETASAIILPGVGHFGQMMAALEGAGLTEPLRQTTLPLLGICLGMQALYETSEEAPGVPGLARIRGEIKRFQDVPVVPHMGWNDVTFRDGRRESYYFANSFYAPAGSAEGVCEYGIEFAAAVKQDKVSGYQFHPEKSGAAGLRLLEDWCRAC